MTLTTHHTELQNCEKCLPSREATSNFAHLPFTFQLTLILVMFFFLATKNFKAAGFFVGGVSSSEVAKKNPPNKFLPTPVCSPPHVSTHPSRNTSHLLDRATLKQKVHPKNGPKLYEACFFSLRGTMFKKKHVGVVRCLQVDYHKE